MPVMTITYQRGAFGQEIARRLALKFGIPIFDRRDAMEYFLADVASPHDINMLNESPKYFLNASSEGITYRDLLSERLAEYADTKSAVMLGFSAHLLLANHPHALHFYVTAPVTVREQRFQSERRDLTIEEVRERLTRSDRKSRRYSLVLYGAEEQDPFLYHVTLNTGKISVDAAVNLIAEVYKDHMAREFLLDSAEEARRVRHRNEYSTIMKDPSEIPFAKVLDMYRIRWIYEPKTFPLEWDEEGKVTMAFSPDFYLPDYDLYLELTVMDQRYTGLKKKKARLLNELYPGTNIEMVYQRDFDHLLRSLSTAGETMSDDVRVNGLSDNSSPALAPDEYSEEDLR
ncbi:MAG: cytidylate kinase family protein [Eubacteriales bacterium]|nr:cytidylate kinase family protein [Eubacteriales bacterium]MDD4323840.1 cytidylate kinase family protein [Eubacteriales bacterium]MDD4541664.1 cytidylate kinase family protein [Eubacteriales bacterium]